MFTFLKQILLFELTTFGFLDRHSYHYTTASVTYLLFCPIKLFSKITNNADMTVLCIQVTDLNKRTIHFWEGGRG